MSEKGIDQQPDTESKASQDDSATIEIDQQPDTESNASRDDSATVNKLAMGSMIIAAASLFLSIIVFFFQAYPQVQPGNDNLIAKANAGNTDTQLFLAHYFYEVGDIQESLYWYKIVTMDKSYGYHALALNNLACIYLNGAFPVDEGRSYHEVEFNLLSGAARAGSPEGRRNLYLLLVSTPESLWKGIEYGKELEKSKKQLMEHDEWTDDLSLLDTAWELVEDTDSMEFAPDVEYVQVKVPAGVQTVSTESGGVRVTTIYDTVVYRRLLSVPKPQYLYKDPPENLLNVGA